MTAPKNPSPDRPAGGGWNMDTLHDYVLKLFEASEALQQQRFFAQDIARNGIDERYVQRFIDSEKAVSAALAAAEKAVAAAMAAADRAVTKAEEAANKRFECVHVDTPVLCADLVWRNAGELQVGDELLAFDEEADASGERQLRVATVTHHAVETDALLAVQTSRGSIRCNAQHPWLVCGPDGTSRWVETRDLKIGDQVTLVGGERHQPRTSSTGDLGSFYLGGEVSEIHFLALNLDLCVPLAVLPERDAAVGGSGAPITGLVLHVRPPHLRDPAEVGAPAVEAVAVDVVGLEGIALYQAKNQAVQGHPNGSTVDVIAGYGVPVTQGPTVAAGKVGIPCVNHGLTLDCMPLAAQGNQGGSVALDNRLSSLPPAGSVATARAVFAATLLNLGDASEETDSALLADTGDEGTFRSIMPGHREASLPGEPRVFTARRGTLLPLLYPVTAIEPVGIESIACLSTSTRTYIADGWAMHNSVNEFRASLSDQTNNMLPRADAEQRFRGIADRIELSVKTVSDKMDALSTVSNNRLAQLEKTQSERTGALAHGETARNQSMWIIGLLASIMMATAAIVASVLLHR